MNYPGILPACPSTTSPAMQIVACACPTAHVPDLMNFFQENSKNAGEETTPRITGQEAAPEMTLRTPHFFTAWGLKTRIVAAFIAAWLIGCTCLAFSLYRVMLNRHHQSIRTRLHDYVAIAEESAVVAMISRDISDLNASIGNISSNSANIEQSADDLRRLAAKLNQLIDRFKS